MRVALAGLLILACITGLQACGKRSGNDIASRMDRLHRCESLEPLKAGLPADPTLEGVPTNFRGCIAPSQVSVTYLEYPKLPEYSYSIEVINPKSKYLEAFAGEEMVDNLDVGAMQLGMRRDAVMREWYTCRGNFNDPPEKRRHILFTAGEFEICVSVTENEQRRTTKAFSVRGDLVYELRVDSEPTGEEIHLERAARAIAPAFGKFNAKAVE
jgi:hypothetical protein